MEAKARRDSAAYEAKRRQILRAATKVFARKGFLGARVGDIASEAGIAYGLIYHYFENKEDLLNSLFQEHWGIALKVMEDIQGSKVGLEEKLLHVTSFFLEAWRMEPDLVEVLMIEVVRSPKFLEEDNLKAFRRSFTVLEGMFREHLERGELRADISPKLLSFLFLGNLEILLTGFVARELLAEDAQSVRACTEAVVTSFLGGALAPSSG